MAPITATQHHAVCTNIEASYHQQHAGKVPCMHACMIMQNAFNMHNKSRKQENSRILIRPWTDKPTRGYLPHRRGLHAGPSNICGTIVTGHVGSQIQFWSQPCARGLRCKPYLAFKARNKKCTAVAHNASVPSDLI
jgi:hypothetical protein